MDLDLTCKQCGKPYELPERMPQTIVECCNNVMCTVCVNNSLMSNNDGFICPFDKKTIYFTGYSTNAFPIQPVMVTLLAQRCADQKGKLSAKKSDQVVPSRIRLEDAGRIKELSWGIEALKKQANDLDDIFEENEKIFIEIVKEKFKGIKRMMNLQEYEISEKVKNFFVNEKKKVKNTVGIDSNLQRNMIEILDNLKQGRTRVDNLTEDTSRFMKDVEYLTTDDHLAGYKQVLNSLAKDFSEEMTQIIGRIPVISNGFSHKPMVEKLDDIYLAEYNNKTFLEVPVRKYDISHVKGLFEMRMKDELLIIFSKGSKVKVEEGAGTEANITEEDLKRASKVCLKMGGYLIDADNMDILRWLWRTLEQATNFKFDFISKSLTNEQLMMLPWDAFKQKKNLQEVEVNLKRCKVGDEGVTAFIKSFFVNITSLRNITINLSSTCVTDSSVNLLASTLKPVIKNLNELRLYLSKTDIKDRSLEPLFTSMNNMKKFSLDLYCTKVTNATLKSFAENSLKTMQNSLEELELNLSQTKVSDDGLSKICIEMPNIHSLLFKLAKNNVSDFIFMSFAITTLSSAKHLQVFELDLKDTNATDSGLVTMLSKLKNLKIFKLDLGCLQQVTGKTVQVLANNKQNIMKSLDVFELNLEGTAVTDEYLSRIFTAMPNVKTFSLNLKDNKRIGNACLHSFIKDSLITMKNIKSLSVNCAGTRVNDEGVVPLLQQIKYAKRTLKMLDLNFEKSEISDKSLDVLIDKKNKLEIKGLEKFNIEVGQTRVLEEGVKLVNELKMKVINKECK